MRHVGLRVGRDILHGVHRWKCRAALAVAITSLAAACSATGAAPPHSVPHARSDRPTAARSARPPRPVQPERLPIGTIGRYAVAQRLLRLVDRSRARPSTRHLPTLVRYPVIPRGAADSGRLARGLFPLVVFAPGFVQCQGSYAALLRAWASAGYVVAAVQFPRTSCHTAAPDEGDLANQPADMAYVIRRVLAASRRPRGPLAGLVDLGEVAVAGHSDGGDTVAAIAAGSCCHDRAVRAAIILAGAEWAPLGGSYFRGRTPPILFVQGDSDTINPPAASLLMYQADRSGPRFYLDLLGAGHLPPYEGHGPPEPVVARVTVDFLDRYLAGQRRAATAMRRDGRVAGEAALVSRGRPPP